MKRTLHACSLLATAMVAAFGAANLALAQVETLNPNPLQPSGIGSGPVGGDYRGYRGNGQMGLGIGPKASGGDENPAETLLREMYRSNYKHPTGKVRFHGPAVRAARRFDPALSQLPALEGGAVYFAERGAYEDTLYRPRQGSYRTKTRTQTAKPVLPSGD